MAKMGSDGGIPCTTDRTQSVKVDNTSRESDAPAMKNNGTCGDMAQEPSVRAKKDDPKFASTTDVNPDAATAPIKNSDSDSEPQYRNIVIVGKIGTGKATIANQIFGEKMFEVSGWMHSVTKSTGVVFKSEPLEKDARVRYNILVMNTVGMHVSDTLSQRHITAAIESFLDQCQSGIHLVLFVFKNDRFCIQDEEAFNNFIKCRFAEDLSEISALFITCCEGLHPTAQQEIRDEFRSNHRLKQITEFMKKGIFTVGFPNTEVVRKELKCPYEEGIKADRERLMNLIMAECKQPHLSYDKYQSICKPASENSCSLQ